MEEGRRIITATRQSPATRSLGRSKKKNTSGLYKELLGKTGTGDQYYESAGPVSGATLKEMFE